MLKTENRFFNISNVKGDMAIYLYIYNFKEYSFSKAGIPLRKKKTFEMKGIFRVCSSTYIAS